MAPEYHHAEDQFDGRIAGTMFTVGLLTRDSVKLPEFWSVLRRNGCSWSLVVVCEQVRNQGASTKLNRLVPVEMMVWADTQL